MVGVLCVFGRIMWLVWQGGAVGTNKKCLPRQAPWRAGERKHGDATCLKRRAARRLFLLHGNRHARSRSEGFPGCEGLLLLVVRSCQGRSVSAATQCRLCSRQGPRGPTPSRAHLQFGAVSRCEAEGGWGLLTQDDGDLFKRVFVGNVVQGACGVDPGHAAVQRPADSVCPVDDDVVELALEHAHQVRLAA